jgi:hypothetical protein
MSAADCLTYPSGVFSLLPCASRPFPDCTSGSCCYISGGSPTCAAGVAGITEFDCTNDLSGTHSFLSCLNRTDCLLGLGFNNENGGKHASTSSSKTTNTVIIASVLIGACAGIVILISAICGIYRFYSERQNKKKKNKRQRE